MGVFFIFFEMQSLSSGISFEFKAKYRPLLDRAHQQSAAVLQHAISYRSTCQDQ